MLLQNKRYIDEIFDMKSSPIYRLANAIIYQSIADYVKVVKNAIAGLNSSAKTIIEYEKSKRFFKSDWCDMLSGDINIENTISRVDKYIIKEYIASNKNKLNYIVNRIKSSNGSVIIRPSNKIKVIAIIHYLNKEVVRIVKVDNGRIQIFYE